MRLKSRFTCTFTHTCCFYSGSTHKYTSTHFHIQIHPKLFYSYLGENSQKHYHILVIPCEINARDILVTTTCYIIPGGWVLWKNKYEEIKRGKCPKPWKKRKKEKVRKEVKMDKCKEGMYPLKRKIKYRASYSPQKPQVQGRYIPPQKRKSRIRLSPLFSPLSPFIRHTCTSWFDLLTCFSGSMGWLCNKCLESMY